MMSSELNIVIVDHCYSKPWSSHPDASNARPLRMLFMDKFPHLASLEKQSSIDIIDLGLDDDTLSIYDAGKTKSLLHDSDVHPNFNDGEDDWEEHIAAVRNTWSVLQNRLFSKVMRVLQADRLARLSVQETEYEAVQRRLQVDKAAKRVRFYFGSAGWDRKLILWLHTLLSENLRGQLLTSYLEVLETLKSKIPSLLEHLIQSRSSRQGFTLETMSGSLKRNLDPVMACINKKKLNRLPDNPHLLLIPNMTSLNPLATKRHKFWHQQLSAMGKVINVYSNNNTSTMQIANYVENMITATRSKILEVKSQFPGRPIILMGWHFGALVASHIALMELAQAVVCLGFPTVGVNGNRGFQEIDDQIYACKTPTLFVVGQHSTCSSTDALEDIREKLKVETGLVLVGGADDLLRMSRTKKHSCGVTQAMVDRCIMEEMFEFLSNILSQSMVKPEVSKDADIVRKQRKRKQKDIQALESQTRYMPQQLSIRAVKSMKLSSGGTFSFGGQWSNARDSKIVKRSSPKKHASMIEGNIAPTKKRMLHRSYTVLEALEDQPGSFSKVSEAAAIASAPELSNLLQIIQNSGQQILASTISSPSVSKNIITSSSTTVTTTTALTLSRFLASSGFFRSDAVMKAKDSISSKVDRSDEMTNKQYLDDCSGEKQTQILFCTSNSSVPLALPVSSKVLKSSPVMRVAGSNSNSLQIQQLLTSDSGSSLPFVTNSSAISNISTPVPTSAIIINSNSTHPSTKSLSPITLGLALSTSSHISSTTSIVSVSSGAAVITIDSDSVFMKETTPSTSVPVTVSIDLGDLALGINSNVRILDSTPKISLIPIAKQMPISCCAENIVLTAAALSSLSHSQHLMFGKPTAVTTKTSSTNAPSTSIISVTSSQLQSTLSSNTGLITLKLTSPSANVSSCSQSMVSGSSESDASANDTYTCLKGSLNLESQSPGISSSKKMPSTSISTQSGEIELHKQSWQMGSSTGSLTFTQSPSSLIITSGNKRETGQFVLQCQKTAPYSSDLQVMQTNSSLTSISTASETLGKVTSLLESSPITMDLKRNPETHGSSCSSTSTNQIPKSLSQSVSSFSSTSSSFISHGQTSLKSNKTGISSYIATPKPSLPTIASTRTRKIKTPKQYDL